MALSDSKHDFSRLNVSGAGVNAGTTSGMMQVRRIERNADSAWQTLDRSHIRIVKLEANIHGLTPNE